jgi:pilus assembly protein FimV
MIRKLSLAVAVATALSPLGLYALGLGDIHTHSALNQEFKADIDLLSTTQEELQDVRVELASPEAFSKAGVDRPFLLTGLKFTPSMTADGQPVITVTSRDPIREPFLNFLVEVNWPKGRLVREYTVLLDPPVTLERTPAPVQAPRVVTAPAQDQAPIASTAETYNPPAVIPSDGERVYGPVQTNDKLWNIAHSLRQGDETVEQVMMALLRYNPEAFIANNVNLLKEGKILRLPEGADIRSMSRQEARREFLAQTREWRQQMTEASTLVGDSPQQVGADLVVQTEQDSADRLELVASKTDEGEQNLDQEGQAERADQLTRLEKQLMIAKEENASMQIENKTLQSKIVQLEAQLEDMQRLLTLRNDQMAELQTTRRLAEQQTDFATPTRSQPLERPEQMFPETIAPEPSAASTADGEEVIRQVNIEQVIAESLQAERNSPPSSAVAGSESAAIGTPQLMDPTDTSKPFESTPERVETASATQTQPLTKPEQPSQAPAAVTPPQTTDLLDSLLTNPVLLGLAGGVSLLLLILLGLIMRRRRQAEAEFAESILVTPAGEATTSPGRESMGAISETSEETSFMSEFSPSDIDALQDETGEVDPISEADVYIAYGRYQQAEELIKQALERSPGREELKHKLLEIYYSAKNEAKFTSLAEELKQAGMEQQKPDLWAKIVAMGRELNPSSALFMGAVGLTAGLAQDEAAGLDGPDLNLDAYGHGQDDLVANTAAKDKPEDEEELLHLSGLDMQDRADLENLDLGERAPNPQFLNSLEAADAEGSMAQQPQDTLDLALDDLDSMVEQSPQAANEDLDLASSLDGLSELPEFQIEDASRDASEIEGDNIVGLENSESLDDLDLESLEKELEMLSGDLQDTEGTRQDAQPREAEIASIEPANQVDISSILSDDLNLNATDDVTNKLDLARAYVDMGDSEGAKSILEEVVTEGSNDQVKQAKELLHVLSA